MDAQSCSCICAIPSSTARSAFYDFAGGKNVFFPDHVWQRSCPCSTREFPLPVLEQMYPCPLSEEIKHEDNAAVVAAPTAAPASDAPAASALLHLLQVLPML